MKRLLVGLCLALSACTPLSPTMIPSPSPQPLTPGTVQVWLTLPDQSQKLAIQPPVPLTAGNPPDGLTVTVDAATTYQRMEGFGAAMTDSSAWLIMNKLDPASRQALLRDLFTREGAGIGLSYLRVPMGASDFARKDYTYNDMEKGQTDPELRRFNIEFDKTAVIPALKQAVALNPQLRLMGSPWSAPAWMKAGGRLNGNALKPQFYAAFADYHVRFVQAYAAEGLTIDAVTPQNEPLHDTNNYPSMYMPAAAQQIFVRDYLGPAFEEAGLQTRILIFDHNWDLAAYPLEVLSDPQAAAFVDGVAFHCYGGDVSAQSKVRNAHPDKGIWFTECSGGGWATDFGGNLRWNLKNLVIGNFRNWGNSLLLWNLALDENDGPQNGGCSNCRGVVTIHSQTGNVTYNEEYYILGHVSKFVDPGAYRIEATPTHPANVAFVNPDGSRVLIVLAEDAVNFNIQADGQWLTYALPKGAVATFVWKP